MAGETALTHEERAERLHLLQRLRKDALTAAGVGIVFAVLFLGGLWLLFQLPQASSADEEILAFYAGGGIRPVLIGGLYVLPLAAVAFMWFVALIRSWFRFRTDRFSGVFSTVQLLSAGTFITLTLCGAGAASVIAAGVDMAGMAVDPDSARQFPVLARELMMIFAMRMAAIFVMTTATIGSQAELFPKWFRIASIAVALALFLAASLSYALVALFPLWVLALCALIIYGSRRLTVDSHLPDPRD